MIKDYRVEYLNTLLDQLEEMKLKNLDRKNEQFRHIDTQILARITRLYNQQVDVTTQTLRYMELVDFYSAPYK